MALRSGTLSKSLLGPDLYAKKKLRKYADADAINIIKKNHLLLILFYLYF